MNEHEKVNLASKAIELGAAIFDEQFREEFGATELQDRMYAALEGDLKRFGPEFWRGYTTRSLERNGAQ